ncbi:WGR domain-containing protein [Rhizobium laguerreae]|uniref:WGR domain-containing protein n=1 Tax=Rhizobium laguerreae TaxID=1076926 RepID=UPI001441AEFB|nr:WGR domain-containing protein [Rhizobium laguerreae]MBY3246345.1 WGR domain-containing protein [Rhizobium laguerreae]MBY3273846.1 WGR domain-containing protein [Rhizobium laguerreae]MBY3468356.1 WGR domain-containing protein [Rhizobium laguerreae]NKN09952.1 WGR domain-containing protein [Rhizobium laguerreae]UFW67117.1 WGR domain-containing protein [Rhizobium laguerreae]
MIPGMSRMSFHLHCQRIDASRNMARYYTLAIEPTLFGETAVVRSWGRIGRRGGERTDVFGTEQEAVAHFLDLARRKRRKGYRPTKAAMPLVMT